MPYSPGSASPPPLSTPARQNAANGREQAIRHHVHYGFPSSFVEHLVIELDRESPVRPARVVTAAVFCLHHVVEITPGSYRNRGLKDSRTRSAVSFIPDIAQTMSGLRGPFLANLTMPTP